MTSAKATTDQTTTAYPQRPPLYVAPLPVDKQGQLLIQRVFIANRGEIACRVIATCRKLNLTSISVYADEDARSRHVLDADESINIGSIDQEAGNPFLNVDLLIKVARSTRADAVHPGYGYLSENAAFSDRVKEAGMIFIGPNAHAILTLGDKRTSKEFLKEHEPRVPLIPGFAGKSQNVKELEAAAIQIGFPVLIKASAGGGGKGIRIVHKQEDLAGELERAQSEAKRSFGSSDCILEKYIEAGKHVEIQIMGDSHGQVVSLWERECSVQRRHQKVIEETPCLWLSEEMRTEMSKAAVRVGKLINYENAGTVEFVVDVQARKFYFLEVNSRLQVEHPITEEVTGLDVVSLQLYVAGGGSLRDLSILDQIPQNGHAIECRLCAEDPERDFYPEHGTVRLWQPASQDAFHTRDVRFETAMETGSSVTIYFDSMIAKIVVWAPTRDMAISRMVTVLSNTVCAGVKTNQLFLQSCLLNPGFQDIAYTTSFIPTHLDTLLKNTQSQESESLRQTLSLIASLYLRVAEDSTTNGSSTAFRNVRRGFRNQPYDPVNKQCSIVTISEPHQKSNVTSPSKQPIVCLWAPQPRDTITRQHQVHISPLPSLEQIANDPSSSSSSSSTTTTASANPKEDPSPSTKATRQITATYNALSNALRSGQLSQSPPHTLSILTTTPPATHTSSTGSTWQTSTLNLSIDSAKHTAHIATTSPPTAPSATQTALGTSLHIHLPTLGTGTFHTLTVFSPLSYIESLRVAVAGATGPGNREVLAPMPCKVLRVLKKSGDEVKQGEVVMVVESMKMEISVSVAVEGKVEIRAAVGDAVDEGKILCKVV